MMWLNLWRTRDSPNNTYQIVNWGDRPQIQIVASQHQKLALKMHELTDLTWVANIYHLDAIPPIVLSELRDNAFAIARAASLGEVFRDMVAIAPQLPTQDQPCVATTAQRVSGRTYSIHSLEFVLDPHSAFRICTRTSMLLGSSILTSPCLSNQRNRP